MIMLLYFLGILIFLFILYSISRHDFVLIRQSISLRQVFDNAFISLFIYFLIGRASYGLYMQSIEMLNPLRFIHIIKYWGILPYIGLVGIVVSLFLLFRKKKNKLRILDIYILSFSPLIVLDILLKGNHGVLFSIKIVSCIVLVIFYGWFIKIHNSFITKDGFITFMTLITYSLVTLAFSLAQTGVYTQKYLWFNIFLIIMTLTSAVLLYLVQKDTFNKQ